MKRRTGIYDLTCLSLNS